MPSPTLNLRLATSPRPPAPTEKATMTPQAILSLYKWEIGSCFRCAEANLYTARMGTIETPSGDTYELRACARCILDLEEERRQYAQRRSLEYRPGSLGP
jgi:hypothetical protein